MRKWLLVLVMAALVIPVVSFAQTAAPAAAPAGKEITEESLLFMDIPVVMTGTLTKIENNKIPAALTVITKEDIAITPARDIVDLLEVYVPGFQSMGHQWPRLGMRGIISDRDVKTLLLLNGKDINQRTMQGASVELNNWDLNDVERIEVIRGPGSVTYGPGAINGVINIVLKSGNDTQGLEAGTKYVSEYNSKGLYLSYGAKKENLDFYGYANLTRTNGVKNAKTYQISNARQGYLNGAVYRSDFLTEPQKQLYFDLNFAKEFKAWFKYSTCGQEEQNSPADMTVANGKVVPTRFGRRELCIFALNNTHDFSDKFNLKTDVAISQQNYADYYIYQTSKSYDEGIALSPVAGNSGNVNANLGERDYSFKTVGSYQLTESLQGSLGATYDYWDIVPAYGKDFISLQWGSARTPGGVPYETAYAKGFSTNSYAFLGELNWKLNQAVTLIGSGRMDKYEWSDYAYSPRLAVISELNKTNILKFIAQQSVRLPNMEDLLRANENNVSGQPEKLTSYELLYTNTDLAPWELTPSLNYTKTNLIGWIGKVGSVTEGTIGNLADKVEIANLELEAKRKANKVEFGASQIFTRLLGFTMSQGVARQGISYDQYNVSGFLKGTGELNLNNWSDYQTKLFATAKVADNIKVHGDLVAYWGYQGIKDSMYLYDQRYGTSNATWNALRSDLNSKGAGDPEYLLNLSAAYKVPMEKVELTTTVYAMNLLGFKRYWYSSGDSATYPGKIGWNEEPATLGIAIQSKF